MSSDLGLEDERLTALGLLFEVASGLHAVMAPAFVDTGLSESEFEVLLRLSRTPGGALRMTDLARQVDLSSSGLTRLVDRLEARGLVERRSCPTDGRVIFAAVAEPGRRLVVASLPQHIADIERWYTGVLSSEQLAALTDSLRTIRDAVRPGAAAGADGAHGHVG